MSNERRSALCDTAFRRSAPRSSADLAAFFVGNFRTPRFGPEELKVEAKVEFRNKNT